VRVASGVVDLKTLAPMTYTKAAGIGCQNAAEFHNPGSVC